MKKEALSLLHRKMLEDTCKTFEKTDLDMVFGEGDLDAEIMLIGEAPGAEETRQKKAFRRQSGRKFKRIFAGASNAARKYLHHKRCKIPPLCARPQGKA